MAHESVTMAMSTFARTMTQRNMKIAKYTVASRFPRRSWKNFSSTDPESMYHIFVQDVSWLQNGIEPPSVGSQLVTYRHSPSGSLLGSPASAAPSQGST